MIRKFQKLRKKMNDKSLIGLHIKQSIKKLLSSKTGWRKNLNVQAFVDPICFSTAKTSIQKVCLKTHALTV